MKIRTGFFKKCTDFLKKRTDFFKKSVRFAVFSIDFALVFYKFFKLFGRFCKPFEIRKARAVRFGNRPIGIRERIICIRIILLHTFHGTVTLQTGADMV